MSKKEQLREQSSSARDVDRVLDSRPFRAAEATRRTKEDLIKTVTEAAKQRNLTQHDAAVLCGTTQSAFSSVVLGKAKHLTVDRLVRWVVALGGTVEIRANPFDSKIKTWQLFVAKAREEVESGDSG